MIARSLTHVYSANDPKEAGDANEVLHECFVEPEFSARVTVRPFPIDARLLDQAFTAFKLIAPIGRQRLRGWSGASVAVRITLIWFQDTIRESNYESLHIIKRWSSFSLRRDRR